ncbi:IS110 family transposase [Sphingomonas sp. Root710]|uniref:IS110 family transposase n=1 Tax=Sphingomonas sp. Root710 TaxID=1736594 RepID=UPI000ACBBD05|nr:IS110 family transposase [Sphingomonas sp. Root710]
MLFVGLDVSVAETSVCIMDRDGGLVREGKVQTDPEAIGRYLAKHARDAERIGLEAGGSSSWLCRELRSQGLRVVHMEARHAHRALSMHINKTDRNDARGLAELMRVGWYKAAHAKSVEAHRRGSLLLARQRLINMRRDLENQARNIMKTTGTMLGSTAGRGFSNRVRAACERNEVLAAMCMPLLKVVATIRDQIKEYDRLLLGIARRDETAKRLMTVPGVGALTSLAFMSAIDDPARFKRSTDVGAYLGLTPRRHQSGEMDWSGRISRLGDGLARTYLFEAASVLVGRIERWSALKAWGVRLTKRVGLKKGQDCRRTKDCGNPPLYLG